MLKEEHLLKNWTWKPMVVSAHLDIDYIKGVCREAQAKVQPGRQTQ